MKKILYVCVLFLVLSGCQAVDDDQKTSTVEKQTKENQGEGMFTINEYRQAIAKNLELHSDKLITKLTEVRNLTFHSNVELLDFQVFMDPSWNQLSIVMFSMSRDANEVFNEENVPDVFAGSMDIAEDFQYYQLADDQRDAFDTFYEQNGLAMMEAEQEVIKNWFVDGWRKAKGEVYKLPVYFSFHDEDKAYDLQENKWISEDELWSF
ncbi:hypothetical protein [Bacillus massiliigorillae]|uniref:hypothetical protein n=1 Tax=Bacillus massiliigorillae TaxID=1243664 RepID=UPI0003A45B09|nr:hypothetical protein [Bacillus massiliigorillae]